MRDMEYIPENPVAGILAPVFCLRGANDLGIGDTGALLELVRWAAENHIGAVQILPVNETGGDFSPYNLRSGMALDPLTIETVPGRLPGLKSKAFAHILDRHDLDSLRSDRVNYAGITSLKTELLQAGFEGLHAVDRKKLEEFRNSHSQWLEPYALFRGLMDLHDGEEDPGRWPSEHSTPQAARAWMASLSTAESVRFQRLVDFRAYVQWVAYSQWQEVRAEADRLHVALIGDVPVGVSIFSSDVWASPSLFDRDRSSGAPPEKVFKSDPFTEQWGQNWGFPLYDWRAMAADNFSWWRLRFRLMRSIFPLLRVDHALGFFRIYSFPWRPSENERFIGLTPDQAAAITGGELPRFVDHDDSTEEFRAHNRRHGELILSMFLEETGPYRILAEDLGDVAPYVRPVLEALKIPGFKIPQWELDGDHFTPGSDYPRLSVATFATHDHPPIRTFWEDLLTQARSGDPALSEAAISEMKKILEFCGASQLPVPSHYSRDVHYAFLEGLLASNAWLAIHMVTDLFGTDLRFNVPGSSATQNWSARIPEPISRWNSTHGELLASFRQMISRTGRQPGGARAV
ncbi:MAG: 4-alpha-glucanotransferase [Terrimicrobiaceae bacterium]